MTLSASRGEIEVIAVLDGYWPDPPIQDDKRVTLIHHVESIGQRQAINEAAVEETVDSPLGMKRTDVHFRNCGSHLGHVFPDGPQPTGLRYCINSVCLNLKEKN